MISEVDMTHLRRCVALAEEAVDAGDQPFGSVLVSSGGDILYEGRNEVAGGDHTRHPEFAIARWAVENMTPVERASATVYTSGEHCPMCAAAHGWVGLGRIVFATSSDQLVAWLDRRGLSRPPVNALPIQAVIRDAVVAGPVPELVDDVFALHERALDRASAAP